MKPTRVAFFVCLSLCTCGLLSAQVAQLERFIELHRKVIVVLDEAAIQNDPVLVRTARHIYGQKQMELDGLRVELDAPEAQAALVEFLSTSDLAPADRLAFSDVVDVTQRGPGPLESLGSELDATRKRFGGEVGTTRGGEDRPAWRRYVDGLRARYPLDGILQEFPLEPRPGQRGTYGEHAVFGYQLPKKHVVLTFDDGPHPRHTEKILSTLEDYGASAYFFAVGQNLGSVADDGAMSFTRSSVRTRLAHEAGHALANHSYSHRQMTKLDRQAREKEVDDTNRLLEALTGESPTLFRPPYGDTSKELTDEYAQAGLTSVLWNVDSWDWGDPIPESIAQRVVDKLETSQRGILLFHDVHKQTVAALPLILERLEAEGYSISTLDGRAATPPTPVTSLDVTRTAGPGDESQKTGISYRESWAVVVGINDYPHWPRLSYAVNDATAIESTLIEQFGFERDHVFTLTDEQATRDNIVELLGQTLADPTRVDREDRVFIFFAGHGATRRLPSGKELGYIVPVDAEFLSYPVRSISMSQLNEFSELIPAKHVYFVMDSCYSGVALTRGGSPNAYVDEITSRTARQILTAGGADETVADDGPGGHSIFTWTLLQGLSGLADLDGNGVLTATELGAFAAPIVSKFSSQTPAFGNLEGTEGGEFVFELEPEDLSAVSQQLDAEALAITAELERLQVEVSAKLQRNLLLNEQVDALRNDGGVASEKERLAQANRHHALGLQYFREKRHEAALAELERALALNPANPTIVNNYGFLLYRMERYEESITWFERTIALDPNRTVVYVNLADSLHELGRIHEAAVYYRRYVELWPSSPRREEIEQLLTESPR